MTTVTEDATVVKEFKHFTSVPFRWSLTGLISNLDMSGKLFGGEILEKVRLVELITLWNLWSVGLSGDIAGVFTGVAAFSAIRCRVIFHSSRAKFPAPVIVQFNSS